MISTEANLGRIFILIGFILGFVGAVFIVVWSIFISQMMPNLIVGLFAALGVIQVIGSIIGVFAFKAASDKKFHQAGILGIVSSVIPPLNIFTLIGGILCITSKEAKK